MASKLLEVLQVLFFQFWIYLLIASIGVIVMIGALGIVWYVYCSDKSRKYKARVRPSRKPTVNQGTILRSVARDHVSIEEEEMPPYPHHTDHLPPPALDLLDVTLPPPAPELLVPTPGRVEVDAPPAAVVLPGSLDIEEGVVMRGPLSLTTQQPAHRRTTLDKHKERAPPHETSQPRRTAPRKAPRTKHRAPWALEHERDSFESCDSFVFNNESPSNSRPSSASSTRNAAETHRSSTSSSVSRPTGDIAMASSSIPRTSSTTSCPGNTSAKPRNAVITTREAPRNSVDDNRFSTRLSSTASSRGELSPKAENVAAIGNDKSLHTYVNIAEINRPEKHSSSDHARDVTMPARDIAPEQEEEENVYADGFSLRADPGKADMIYENHEVEYTDDEFMEQDIYENQR